MTLGETRGVFANFSPGEPPKKNGLAGDQKVRIPAAPAFAKIICMRYISKELTDKGTKLD